jgi:hypothetical protein
MSNDHIYLKCVSNRRVVFDEERDDYKKLN